MIDIHSSSNQRINDMVMTKYVVDEDETFIAMERNDIDDSMRNAVVSATTADNPFFDSFVSVEVMPNDSNARNSSRHLNTGVDDGSNKDDSMSFGQTSFHFTRGTSFIGNRKSSGSFNRKSSGSFNRKSSGSFDFNDSYLDETAVTNRSLKKGPLAREQRVLNCVLFGLLVLAGILAVLSAINYNATICAYASLVVIGAIGIIFLLYDFRSRQREALLIRSVSRSEAIVNSLFPEIVRDRILEEGNWVGKKVGMRAARPGAVAMSSTANAKNNNTNKRLPDTTTTIVRQIQEDSNGNDDSETSYGYSNSGSNNDDPIQKIPRMKLIPSVASPKTKQKPSFLNRRSSNESSNTTDFDSSGVGDPPLGNSALANSSHSPSLASSKPIADYFPCATIMFADIVGFTSWASVREPVQVFELLETIYGRFDIIAKKKGVFKVETIGDCYVAATGLPNARNDHAVAMASFARRCLECMLETAADLEESLGPGTADLGMRVGIHSGSVIGGVLRGAKSRYQLFGDTMNTASRIESTSSKNKIHLSEQTAELIMEVGKAPWVEPRRETIFAKGKGELKTYWLTTEAPKNLTARESKALPALLKLMEKANIDPGFIQEKKADDLNEKRERLVDYHTNVLKGLLTKLLFVRSGDGSDADGYAKKGDMFITSGGVAPATKTFAEQTMEGIIFPRSAKSASIASSLAIDADECTIDSLVSSQLRELVSRVSSWYRNDLPFHTFEHASHTVLSITKLLSAIKTTHTSTDIVLNKTKLMITHPLCQFVLVFAALVHDAGDGDAQDTKLVAAEKSTRRAWSLFLEPAFRDLRGCICRSWKDFEFFRRLLGKSIVAVSTASTDSIQDPGDWNSNGLSGSKNISSAENQVASRKAMNIIETLLRVSDVSYAIQHFPVFEKWNKLLFEEAYGTYKSETNESYILRRDPSVSWYEKELESFDDRICLVKELRDSGVFNKLADVYLNAAIANRRVWEQKGKPIVEEYLSTPK